MSDHERLRAALAEAWHKAFHGHKFDECRHDLDRTAPLIAALGPAADAMEGGLAWRAAVLALKEDRHRFQPRPCDTCERITALLGEAFGCDWVTADKRRRGRDERGER